MNLRAQNSLVLHIPTVVLTKGSYTATPAIDLHATDLTIAAKIKLATVDVRNILFCNWGSPEQLMFSIQAGGRLAARFQKDILISAQNPGVDLIAHDAKIDLSADTWYHVAVTLSWGADRMNPTSSLYIDGTHSASETPTVTPSPGVRNPYTLMPTDNPYLIGHMEGRTHDNSWFQGEIQNLRVYRIALDDAEIAELASA